MFMAAGLMAEALGHDRIAGLASIGRALPITLVAFALGGLSMIGLPPGGAKSMLFTAAVNEGQWWWGVVILGGGVLAAAYILPVLLTAFQRTEGAVVVVSPVARYRELLVLALALCALSLGYLPISPYEFVQVGRP